MNMMQNNMNRSRAAVRILFVMVGLLFVQPPFAHAQSAEAHQQFLFGYKLLQNGDYKLAGEAFDKYLLEYPQDDKRGDALFYRAMIAQRTGDNGAAAAYLRNPPEPKHVQPYMIDLLRGQVHSDLGQFDSAIAALERIPTDDIKDAVVRASVFQLLGRAHQALGNLGGAVTNLRKASELETPLKSRSLLDLARVHIIRAEHDKALAALKDCLKLQDAEHAPEAARLAGDQCYKLSQFDEAEKYYREILNRYENSPHYGAAVVGTLWAELSKKEYQQMLDTYAKYHKAVDRGNRVSAAYLVASAHLELHQFKQANELFNAIHQEAKGTKLHEQILYKKASSEFELGQYEQMNTTLQSLFATYPQSKLNMDGQFLIAAAEARQGDFAVGIRRLSAIIDHEPKHPYHDQALLQRADLFRRNNQFEKAVDDYVRYFGLPGKINDRGQFVDHKPVMRLLDLQYRLERYDAVDKTADRLLSSDPPVDIAEEAAYRQGLARIKLERLTDAVATFTHLLETYPDSQFVPHWNYYRGLLLISGKDRDEGVKNLNAAAASDKLETHLRTNALRMMALAYREKGDTEATAQTLAKLKQFSGLTADEMFWLARRFAAQSEPKQALEFLEPLLDPQRRIPSKIRGDAIFLAGRCYHDTGQYDKAAASFQKLIDDRHAYATQARLHKARALEGAGKREEALTEYEKLSTATTSSIAANALYDAAHLHLAIAQDAHRLDDQKTVGTHRKAAAEKFRKVTVLFAFADLSPIPESCFVELAHLLESSDQPAEAKDVFEDLVKKFPDSPFADYARAMLDLSVGKRGDARSKLDQLFRQRELHPPSLNHMVDFQLKKLEGV